jgi:hypothetical protein
MIDWPILWLGPGSWLSPRKSGPLSHRPVAGRLVRDGYSGPWCLLSPLRAVRTWRDWVGGLFRISGLGIVGEYCKITVESRQEGLLACFHLAL